MGKFSLHRFFLCTLVCFPYLMQPLEFLKFTPKNNCGECGYPACLAFAAAVTKGGENPEKCPYVDVSALGDAFAVTDHGQDGLDGVGRLLDEKDMALVAYLKEKTSSIDFCQAAEKIGCTWSGVEKDCLLLQFLGRDVELCHDHVLIDGEEVVDPRDQILLYNYVHFGGGEKPKQKWIGMESLPNSISKVRTLRVYCEERLSSFFAGKTEDFIQYASALGAVLQKDTEQSCSAAFLVSVLPHLPMLVLFWDEEKEDNFPAKVKVLFDEKVMDYLDIESLVFACERMAERWVELAE